MKKFKWLGVILLTSIMLATQVGCPNGSNTTNDNPSNTPSNNPSGNPSDSSTDNPTNNPSDNPSDTPSDNPSDSPSDNPSDNPADNQPRYYLTLTRTSLGIKEGHSVALNALTNVPQEKITWTSSDERYVKVDEYGIITAGNIPGTVTITAKAGDISSSCEVTVCDSEVLATKISFGENLLIFPGEKRIITIMIEPAYATEAIYWESSNSAVATVQNGIATGVRGGKTTIKATCQQSGKSATCNIEVTTTFVSSLINEKTPDFVIPEGYTEIKGSPFGDWLETVSIPSTMSDIYSYGSSYGAIEGTKFSDCLNLTSINVAEGNNSYSSENGVLFNKDKTELILYPRGKKDSSYEIPNSVIKIDNSAFTGCTNLTSLTIPSSVASIGDYYMFEGCSSLSNINVDSGNLSYSSENGVLFNKDKTTLIRYPMGRKDSSYEIPNSVTSIDNYAFGNCSSSLVSITIPNGVTSIGWSAFGLCLGLTNITIPDSVTSIGQGAFYYCTNLTSTTIGNSMTSIGSYAFSGCSSLTSATFKNPNGWRYSYSSNATSGTAISSTDLSDPSIAAKYLREDISGYCNYSWHRD